MFRKIFIYFEPAWSGNDRRVSLRAILAIAFSIDFIRNLSHAIFKWEIGRSLDSLAMILGIEAGLIVALLGLSTYQNLATFGKVDANQQEWDKKDKDRKEGDVKQELGKNKNVEQ